MQRELVRAESAEVAVQPQAGDILTAIQRAASDPTVDAAKMRELWQLAKDIRAEQAEVAYIEALRRVQADKPRMVKDGRIVVGQQERSRYVRLETIEKAMKPLLDREGFALDFNSKDENGKLVVLGTLRHVAGHSETKQVPLSLDTSGSKNGTQATGSTVTYGQRYLYKMFFGIVEIDEDDDGNNHKLEPITVDQSLELEDLMQRARVNVPKLLAWLGVKAIGELPKSRYTEVKTNLNDKIAGRR